LDVLILFSGSFSKKKSTNIHECPLQNTGTKTVAYVHADINFRFLRRISVQLGTVTILSKWKIWRKVDGITYPGRLKFGFFL